MSSLIRHIKGKTPQRVRRKGFVELLPPKVAAELLELKRAFAAGELPGWTRTQLWQECQDVLGLSVGLTTFRDFLRQGNGKAQIAEAVAEAARAKNSRRKAPSGR